MTPGLNWLELGIMIVIGTIILIILFTIIHKKELKARKKENTKPK